MRIFFALELMPSAMLEIATWRDRSFRGLAAGGAAHPVPPGNFHITLAFMGDVAEHKREVLCDRVSQSLKQEPIEAVSLTINELGYWQRQGILWLGPKRTPPELQQLANRLKGLGSRVGGKQDNKLFRAHITLFRRCKLPPPPPLEPPDFSLHHRDFVLLESRQGKRGVSYHTLQRWQLSSRR